MSTAEILKKQISKSYPAAASTVKDELIGVEIKDCGRLFVDNKLGIFIIFQDNLYNEKMVQLFFSPRIKSEYMRIYFSKSKFQAYPKTYGVKIPGEFELAMEYFAVFKEMHDSIIEFISYSK